MEELCTACLCAGRNLYFIGGTDYFDLYLQILNEIPVYHTRQICIRVCWECRALLRRLGHFRAQVKHSYELLSQHQKNMASIAKAPHLQVYHMTPVSFPYPVEELKKEVEVKEEVEDQTVEHCEPETFVNDFLIEVPPIEKTAKVKEKKKKSKEKKVAKKNIKAKRKRKKSVSIDYDNALLDNSDVDYGDNKEDVDVEQITEAADEVYSCKECDVRFQSTEELSLHVEAAHRKIVQSEGAGVEAVQTAPQSAGERPQCADCGKTFSSRKTYRYHLNVLHKGQNRHACPRCGKVYQWKSNLGRHMRTHKARDSGELYCGVCDKKFASVATFRQHLRVSRRHVSESEFSYMCTECGKKFPNKTRLRDHVDWEHLHKIKFRCHLCNKPFKCHTSRYVHMQNVHRDKEKKENLCHVCGKSYQNAAKLKYHIVAMHSGETPYRCAHAPCAAAFGWYSSLYRHIREVHYKMKLQPNKKTKKAKRSSEVVPPLPPLPPLPPPLHGAPA